MAYPDRDGSYDPAARITIASGTTAPGMGALLAGVSPARAGTTLANIQGLELA